jgi:putative restriction endonuclease
LVTKPGKQLPITKSRSIKSFPKLKETVAFAEVDKKLFVILQNSLSRQLFTEILLETYFSATKAYFSFEAENAEQQQLEFEILNEPTAVYQQHLAELKAKLVEEEFEEELFVRGSVFKKTVPKIYDYTCCISGMKVSSTKHIQMVDACHIYPVSLSKDDTVPNGIALSPNLHRAFDRGLITINKEYVVRVSPTLQDNNSVYGIAQFEGVNIQLPKNYAHYPSQQALAWHNKEVFLL